MSLPNNAEKRKTPTNATTIQIKSWVNNNSNKRTAAQKITRKTSTTTILENFLLLIQSPYLFPILMLHSKTLSIFPFNIILLQSQRANR
jgi:hypothetical protein